MNWFKIQSSACRHEKTLRLADALGVSKYEAVGYLMALWGSVYDMRPDGDLRGLSWDVLASAVDLGHRAGEFVQALIDARLIDADEDGSLLKIHNAERYTERHRRTQQQRTLREKARQKREAKAARRRAFKIVGDSLCAGSRRKTAPTVTRRPCAWRTPSGSLRTRPPAA